MTDTTKLPKWAQSLLADITRERDEARALLPRTEPVPERMALPSGYLTEDAVFGWDFNPYTGCVVPCWTTSVSNWFNRQQKPVVYGSGSQGGRQLFATRRAAMVALRAAKSEEFGRVLAGIDAEIGKDGEA